MMIAFYSEGLGIGYLNAFTLKFSRILLQNIMEYRGMAFEVFVYAHTIQSGCYFWSDRTGLRDVSATVLVGKRDRHANKL